MILISVPKKIRPKPMSSVMILIFLGLNGLKREIKIPKNETKENQMMVMSARVAKIKIENGEKKIFRCISIA